MRSLFWIALLAVTGLAGCASGPVHLPIDNLSDSSEVRVEDLRPQSETTTKSWSSNIFSERYGYLRVGEDATEPTGPRLFAHRLHEKAGSGPGPASPTKLRHFVVYLNMRAEIQRSAAATAIGTALDAMVIVLPSPAEEGTVHSLVDSAGFEALAGDQEYKRAQYSDSEVSAKISAYVVFIETETEGQRRFTRTIAPTRTAQPDERIPLHRALEAAIQFHLAD